MTKKRLSIAMVFLLVFSGLFAQQISQEEAIRKASAFYGNGISSNAGKKMIALRKKIPPTPVLVYTGGNPANPDFFVYNINGGGFVMVAADARMPEQILAYSLNGAFNPDIIPEPLQDILKSYSEKARQARNQTEGPNRYTRQTEKPVTLAQITQVGPLLADIRWDQGAPYNNACPLAPDGKTHYYTGCVATATAQVMKYWGWPAQGTGTHKNTENPDAKTNYVDYSKQTYNWSLMLPAYKGTETAAQKAEVAKLMTQVGNAVNMEYKSGSSAADSQAIPTALREFFSYSPNMQFAFQQLYTYQEWINMIKREIDNKRPVLNGGSGSMGLHQFVCDGYDSSNKLHYNYGWSGGSDGYYTPAGMLFPDLNNVITGIRPNNITVEEENEAIPQIAQLLPFYASSYSVKTGQAFSISTIIGNYDLRTFNGKLGIALYQNGKMVTGAPLAQKNIAINPSGITSTVNIAGTEFMFNDFTIPANIPDGANYKLRMVVSKGSAWFPAAGVAEDVTKEVNVQIAANMATLSYPQSTALTATKLELVSPIDVNIANNRATVKFSIRNANELFICKNTDIFILANSNASLIPSVWQRATIDSLASGLIQNFELKDVPVPPGTNVNSCCYYIAFNPIKARPAEKRSATALPILPYDNNFKVCQVPKETEIMAMNFENTAIPATYTKYNGNWEIDNTAWKKFSTHNAFADKKARLVTPEITVGDENYVLEWYMGSLYGDDNLQTIYIATDGMAFDQNIQPAYSQKTFNKKAARLNLSAYVGKKIRIAFEAPTTAYYLDHFKLLNIRTPKDISVQQVIMEGSAMNGQSMPLRVLIKNHSANSVRKVTASYTVGNEQTVTETFETDVLFNDTTSLTFSKPILAKGIAGEMIPVKVHVQQEGEEQAQMDNNDGTAQYMIVNFFPQKNFLVFKAAKMSCPGCWLMYSALEQIEEDFPANALMVELWRDGAYQTTDYIALTRSNTPVFYLNGIWNNTKEQIETNMRNQKVTASIPADIIIKTGYENQSSRTINIQAKCRFAMPVNGEYKLGFILVENNVTNTIGQIAGTHPTGEKLVINYIPVGFIGGEYGATSTMKINNPQAKEYTFSCNYDIPAETAYRYRKDNIQVIGVLYGPKGEIVNSATDVYYLKLPETEGLTFIPAEGYATPKRIYDVKSIKDDNYQSVVNYRVTLPIGAGYKFRIEKSEAWKGRNFRLVVNPETMENRIKKEVMYPDVDGFYNIENAKQHYFFQIEEVEDNAPSVMRNGGQLIHGETWTANELNSLRLSYEYLTSVDFSGIGIPAGVNSLDVTNPNTLIYTAADADIPASWKNVIKGNVAETIMLQDGYLFGNTKEFTANTITYQCNYPYTGWNAACLPFAVSALPEGISAEEFFGNEGTGLSFKKVETLAANTPYILNVTTAGEKVYKMTDVIVPATEIESVENGDYSFKGTYENKSGVEMDGLYLLNSDGNEFCKANSANTISPFRSYITYAGNEEGPSSLTISHQEGNTDNIPVNSSGDISIHYVNNAVELITSTPRLIKIYGVDGSLVCTKELRQGANPIRNLPKGIYLVEKMKLIIN